MHHTIHNVRKNTKYLKINVEIMICDSRIFTWFSDSSSDSKWFLEPLTWFGIVSDPSDRVVAIILIKLCYAEEKPFELTQSFYTALLSIRHSLLLDITTLGVIPHCWYLTWFFTGVTIFFVLQSTVSGRASLPVNGNFKLPSVLFAMLTLDR